MIDLLDKIRTKSFVNVPSEVRAKNIASSLRRNLPSIAFGVPHGMKIAVVGSGPSVNDDIEEIRNFDGFVMAINGMHDFLIERDIIPDAVVIADGLPSMVKYFQNPRPEITYLVCSSCDPAIFDALEGCKIILWHPANENLKKGTVTVCTGPSAVTTAPYLLYMIGYRDIHLFGVDSSVPSYESHAHKGGEAGEMKLQVMVGETVYLSTMQFVLQAAHLRDFNKLLKDEVKLNIHGYGLVKAIFENNGEFELI